ncbi:Bacteriophage protein gp37 [Fuerstiella marisgermanici]|uniref:Bacteriophage protein gp37 n=2 Tax=Fuerstiella marisgermanici TaxID=1891926 RepID=A0A1P8WGV0_9PLAN|nr:Bacteriophage protein gp37 [Fuerstiella marisgermanici]
MGCDGCELWSKHRKTCYAGTLHQRFGGSSKGYAPTFKDVTPFPGRMREAAKWSDLTGTERPDKPWLNGLPRLIFVSDMSDSLSKAVKFEYLEQEIIENVRSKDGQRHCWLWLTKRPKRMAEFSRWLEKRGTQWPSNLWAGTSVTDQASTARARDLLDVGDSSTVRFLSVEPQVEPADLGDVLPNLDWVIHGGESGHGSRMFDTAWAKELISQCKNSGVPYFLKQLGAKVVRNGKRLEFDDAHAGDWTEWPKNLRIRKFPQRTGVAVQGREISATSYLDYILFMLKTDGGYMQTDTLYDEIFEEFSLYMSEADLKPMAKRKTPKWKNMVDWAKASGAKSGKLAAVTHESKRYVVLLDNFETDTFVLKLVKKQKKKPSSFKKRCPNCSTYQSMSNRVCVKCKTELPVAAKREIRRSPR